MSNSEADIRAFIARWEEANGLIRWLRPDYQRPNDASTLTAQDIAALFGKRSKKRIAQVNDWLNTLTLLGQARQLDDGRFVAV